MKKIILLLTVGLLSIASYGSSDPINRLDKQTVKEMSDEDRVVRIAVLENRVSAIQELDLQKMNSDEKRQTKKELRYINKELKAQANGGIYISATALVIIIILLILL